MATSAWGTSWGGSWGSSWGTVAATVTEPTDISQSFVEDRHGRLKGQRKVQRLAARAVLSYGLKKAILHKIASRKTARL